MTFRHSKYIFLIFLLLSIIGVIVPFLFKKDKINIAQISSLDFPTMDTVRNWQTKEIPNSNLKIALPPADNGSSSVNLQIVKDEIATNLYSLPGKYVAGVDVAYTGKTDACTHPSYRILVYQPDITITSLKEIMHAKFDKEHKEGQNVVDYEYARDNGIYTTIQGTDVFMYKVTEDLNHQFAYIYTKNGLFLLDTSLSNMECGVYSDFSFINLVKGIIRENKKD